MVCVCVCVYVCVCVRACGSQGTKLAIILQVLCASVF